MILPPDGPPGRCSCRSLRLRALPCALLLLLIAPRPASAGGALGAEGEPISGSGYAIDMFEGPVLSSSRVSGLAGAFAGLAEGVDGDSVNAAAPALRMPWSHDWFDYDLSAGATFPGTVSQTDFDNNGDPGFVHDRFLFLTVGANLQMGRWGVGLTVDGRTYQAGEGSRAVQIALSRMNMLIARGFWRGQLLFGLGARAAALELSLEDSLRSQDGPVFSTAGVGLQAGALWSPHQLPLRVGLTARQAVRSTIDPESRLQPDSEGDVRTAGIYLPQRVELPWELEAGVAVELTGRPLNSAWVDPGEDLRPVAVNEREALKDKLAAEGLSSAQKRALKRESAQRLEAEEERHRESFRARWQASPRRRLVLSAALLVSGPSADAVGVESFFQQRIERSGERASFTPRLGLEGEPWHDQLQLRAGTYLEPTRYDDSSPRLHGTAGFDLKLLPWSVFGLFDEGTWWAFGGFADVTSGYYSAGVRVGVWH